MNYKQAYQTIFLSASSTALEYSIIRPFLSIIHENQPRSQAPTQRECFPWVGNIKGRHVVDTTRQGVATHRAKTEQRTKLSF